MEAIREDQAIEPVKDISLEDLGLITHFLEVLLESPSTDIARKKQAIILCRFLLVAQFRETISEDEVVDAWNNLGVKFRRLGYWHEGLDASRKALDYAGYKSPVHLGIANSLVQLGMLSDAIPPLQEALRLSESRQDTRTTLQNLGEVFLLMGYHDIAIKHLTEALQVDVNLEGLCWSHFLLALVFLSNDNADEFEQECEKLAALIQSLQNNWEGTYYTNPLRSLVQKSPVDKFGFLEAARQLFEFREKAALIEVQRLAKYVLSIDMPQAAPYDTTMERPNNTALNPTEDENSNDDFDIEKFIAQYDDLDTIHQEIEQKRKTARPLHPTTGEPGTFVEYASKYPLYRTESGEEFILHRGTPKPLRRK